MAIPPKQNAPTLPSILAYPGREALRISPYDRANHGLNGLKVPIDIVLAEG